MKIVLQRVSKAEVRVDREIVGAVGKGVMLLLGVQPDDTKEDIDWLVGKVVNMRIFDDENGVMNLSIKDIEGEILVVSQFTLMASTRKGNRPSYIGAARPEIAIPLYEEFKKEISTAISRDVASGVFGADMKCELINDGPVTIIIDSKNRI
ncbi:MAG: D-aminoacyl-tRNA deacylase [Rikenellaceae bacterium]